MSTGCGCIYVLDLFVKDTKKELNSMWMDFYVLNLNLDDLHFLLSLVVSCGVQHKKTSFAQKRHVLHVFLIFLTTECSECLYDQALVFSN